MAPRVWFITGCSSGFGVAFAQEALSRGDQVIATGLKLSQLEELKKAGAATLELDVTSSPEVIRATVEEAIKIYGRIDILLNNAGAALLGPIEEIKPEEEQNLFQVNVFGPLNVTRAVLPHMRAQKSGIIFFMSSLSGWIGGTSSAVYSASKGALSLYAESLRGEVKSFGITVGCLEPGAFRTNFLGPSHMTAAAHSLPDYDDTVCRTTQEKTFAYHLKQRGDVKKGAAIMADIITSTGVAEGKELPVKLVIGADAYDFSKLWCESWLKTLEEWRDVIVQTDIEKSEY
ncbi:NAD(P)-binding protein [Thozetella sp. PMI_491]|nr:NAD(P)-binding protein [Thozetella sp. PMI_491]